MKRLSPKGKMHEEMWRHVARGMDGVGKVIEHCKELLHMQNDEATRITHIDSEIVKFRAVLRCSGMLQGIDKNRVCGMDRNELIPILNNFVIAVEIF